MQFKTVEELTAMSIAELDSYFAQLEAERLKFRAHAKAAKEVRDLRNRQANEAAKAHKNVTAEELRLKPGVALADFAAAGMAGNIAAQARKAGLTPEQVKKAIDAGAKA